MWRWVEGQEGREAEARWDQVFCADLPNLTDAKLWGRSRVWCVCVCVCVIHLFVGEARPLTDAPLAQSFVLHHGSQPGLLRKDARCLNSALHVRSVHGAVRIADKGHSVPHIRGIFEQQSGECPLQ